MKLETAIQYLKGEMPIHDPASLSREVGSFVIDTREIAGDDVFIALSQPEYRNAGFNGDFADSTGFVAEAFDKGALACVVRKDRFEEHKELEKFLGRLIFVEDGIAALQQLAHRIYLDWNGPVVGITGSAGKTTAKELTSLVLEGIGKNVLRNEKNYNNGLGHPLTVLKLDQTRSFDVAVLEMGMSTPLHEIQRLCNITPPDVAVVLNVLPVHLEHLGSIENIANAKAELVEGLKSTGTAVLNADDPRVLAMGERGAFKSVTFGIDHESDVRALDLGSRRFGETNFRMEVFGDSADVSLPLSGRHSVYNALAAAAVGCLFGSSVRQTAESLCHAVPPPQCGEVLHFAAGFTVVNDSYNSNPDALLSMVRMLAAGAGKGNRTIVVAGEMLELGPEAAKMHRAAGTEISRVGIDRLYGVRGLAADLVEGAKGAGLNDAYYPDDSTVAAEVIASEIRKDDVVLVKGSRGVRTEKVVEKLVEMFELEADS